MTTADVVAVAAEAVGVADLFVVAAAADDPVSRAFPAG